MKNQEKYLEYYPNGEKNEEGIYKNGKKDGLWKEWWDNGVKRREVCWKNGVYNGVLIWWNRKGQKTEESNYSNNKKDGKYLSYYDNGQIKEEGYYNNDCKTGTWKKYYDNGEIAKESNWEKGYQHGITVKFHGNGTIYAKGEWANDQRIGEHIIAGEPKIRTYVDGGGFIDDKGRLIKLTDDYLRFCKRHHHIYDYKCFIMCSHNNLKSVSYHNMDITLRLMDLFLQHENPYCVMCEKSDKNITLIPPADLHPYSHIRDYNDYEPIGVCSKCNPLNIKTMKDPPSYNKKNSFLDGLHMDIKYIENELNQILYKLEICQYCGNRLFQFLSFKDKNIIVECINCHKETTTFETIHKLFDR